MTAEPLEGPAAQPGRGSARDRAELLAGIAELRQHRLEQPDGKLTLPKVSALSSRSERAYDRELPLDAQLAAIELSALIIDDILAERGGRAPTWDEIPLIVENKLSVDARRAFGVGLGRRGVAEAGAFVGEYLRHHVPPHWSWHGPAVTRAVAGLRPVHSAEATAPLGRRLAWAEPTNGLLLLDRISMRFRRDTVLDEWMQQQVDADVQLGRALAGDNFRGVRVLCGRSLFISVHVLDDSTRHDIGYCRDCTPGGLLP